MNQLRDTCPSIGGIRALLFTNSQVLDELAPARNLRFHGGGELYRRTRDHFHASVEQALAYVRVATYARFPD